MARTPAQAVAYAKGVSRYTPSGMCQQFTRVCFNIGSGFGSASAAWHGAKKRHYVNSGSQVPAGVPVYWLGGSRGFGHAAVSLGGGYCRSTDWPSIHNVGTARIDDITRLWGQNLVGWTEDINGVSIPGIGAPKDNDPDIQLEHVIRAAKNGGPIYHGKRLKAALAKEVGKGDMNLASPVLGPAFVKQYSKLQEKKFNATGSGANGIPGRESLTWLGKRHDFDVK